MPASLATGIRALAPVILGWSLFLTGITNTESFGVLAFVGA